MGATVDPGCGIGPLLALDLLLVEEVIEIFQPCLSLSRTRPRGFGEAGARSKA